MKKQQSNIFLLVFFLYASVYSQIIDSLIIRNVSTELINTIVQNEYGEEMIIKENCVVFNNGNKYCYDVETKSNWKTDFNYDGETDLLYRITGQNRTKDRSKFYVVLLKNKKINKIFIIQDGITLGKLVINDVKKGKIFASFLEVQNKNSSKNPREEKVVFKLIDGYFTEENYEYCPMSVMKKSIFKGFESEKKFIREYKLNEKFNEEVNESYQIDNIYPNRENYYARLTGCEEISLNISKFYYQTDESTEDSILKMVDFLINSTRFATFFSDLKKKLITINYKQLIKQNEKGIEFKVNFSFSNGWKSNIFFSNYKGGTNIKINSSKKSTKTKWINEFQFDFWESFNRKKQLRTTNKHH